MHLSVVIPARNEEQTLPRQLDALLAQEWDKDWEVVVVDNGSTDGTAEVVTRLAQSDSRLRLISAVTPGACHARNAGIAATSAPLLAFCDADDVVEPGWIAAIAAALAEHELVTGAQELRALNPRWLVQSRGLGATQGLTTFYGVLPYPSGNNFGVRRSLIDLIGGLRQEYFGAEDLELGVRAWQSGVVTKFVPEAVVNYAYRRSAAELWRQGFSYGVVRPKVARDLVNAELPRPPLIAGWRSWAWLVVNGWRLATRPGRARWLWVAGNRVGHLVGSIRHRTVLL